MKTIDLNCDMGEAFGSYAMPNDEKLMEYISSANIACGFHAGDPAVMQQTVSLAIKNGVAIGAHPGLPDLQGFGRREMKITPNDAYQLTLYQMGALAGFVKAAGSKLHHVKVHGALYNMAAKDTALAKAIAQAILDFDPGLMLYALAGSKMIEEAEKVGIATASEVFADRSYQDNGLLTPRGADHALITNDEDAVKQVLGFALKQQVSSVNGNLITVKAETVCLHGDGEHALAFASLIAGRLKKEGIMIKAPLI